MENFSLKSLPFLFPKIIIFDLDGLIINSLPMLSDALFKTVKPYFTDEDSLKKFVTYDLANPGISRFEKIDFALNLCNIKESDRVYHKKRMLNDFNNLALLARCDAEIDQDIFNFIYLHTFNVKIFLLSNCDNSQLNDVIHHHKLDLLFDKNFYGTPPNKSQTFHKIITDEKCQPKFVWSISDSKSDLEIANKNFVKFFWIQRFARETLTDKEITGKKFKNLKELLNEFVS